MTGTTSAAAAKRKAPPRPTPLRLAGLHLRMGSLALARAELESLAGRSMLDEAAMLDLAEVRWRTGDLPGAGEAANAVIARGREDALALAIAAEAIAALGRPGEARRLAARASAASGGSLDALFAGIPRSHIWPGEPADDDGQPDGVAGTPGVEPDTHPTRDLTGPGAAVGSAAGAVAASDVAPPPASTGAAESYAGGRAALGAGDIEVAAVRLGVALRLEPAFARDVLDAIGERDEPALLLVSGDALRLLGRESEALAAFDRARGHQPASTDDAVADDDATDTDDDAGDEAGS